MQRLTRSISSYIYRLLSSTSTGAFMKNQDLANTLNQQNQIALRLMYRQLQATKQPLPLFDEVEFRSHSQNGEDGILLFIFSLIGTTNKKCVEICAGGGIQCNSANLILNHGWYGLLFDGDPDLVKQGNRFFQSSPDTFFAPPIFKQAWITKENVNSLIQDNGFIGEIDLLTVDVDGNDWWIWQAITIIRPRVVVVEINLILKPDVEWVMPYQADFSKHQAGAIPYGYGASLSAFVALARSKGYRLIGTESSRINAFFMRDDIGEDIFPEVNAASCLVDNPFIQKLQAKYYEQLLKASWIEASTALVS